MIFRDSLLYRGQYRTINGVIALRCATTPLANPPLRSVKHPDAICHHREAA